MTMKKLKMKSWREKQQRITNDLQNDVAFHIEQEEDENVNKDDNKNGDILVDDIDNGE